MAPARRAIVARVPAVVSFAVAVTIQQPLRLQVTELPRIEPRVEDELSNRFGIVDRR